MRGWTKLCLTVVPGLPSLSLTKFLYDHSRYGAKLTPVGEHEVIHAWLKAETANFNHRFAWAYLKQISQVMPGKLTEVKSVNLTKKWWSDETHKLGCWFEMMNSPDLTNVAENEARRAVFQAVRGDFGLWKPIEASTKWYRLKVFIDLPGLGLNESQVHAPFHPELGFITRFNLKVFEKTLQSQNSDLNNIILWGHNIQGPLMVLEGNHRWYSRSRWPSLVTIYLGLSDQAYYYHKTTGCSTCQEATLPT